MEGDKGTDDQLKETEVDIEGGGQINKGSDIDRDDEKTSEQTETDKGGETETDKGGQTETDTVGQTEIKDGDSGTEREEKQRSLYRNGRRPLEMDEGTKKNCRCRFGLKCKFLVLTILVVAYVVGGAWVFVALEDENQRREEQADEDALSQAKEAFYGNLSYLLEESGMDNLTKLDVASLVEYYVSNISSVASTPERLKWDWTSGCFFCITILTTIGYGGMVPKTQMGKIACMVYAVVGIPLFLIFLAKLGDILVNAIRKCHKRCCGRKKRRGFSATGRNASSRQSKKGNGQKDDEQQSDADIPISPFIVVFILYMGAGSGMFYVLQKAKGWNIVDALYFVVVTFTTIGFGDLVPAYGEGQDGGLLKIKDLTQKLSDDLNIGNINFNITKKEEEYIRHAEFALLIWYIIIGMVIMSCIFNLLLVRLRHLSDLLATKRRRDKFALNQNTFDMSGEGKIRKMSSKYP